MATPHILLTIDTPLLATSSRDTLVLSRKVNGVFATALAVGSPNPRDEHDTNPLYSQNIFSWDNNNNNNSENNKTFRVAVSRSSSSSSSSSSHGGSGAGALTASITNAVEIGHGETARFSRNLLVLTQPGKDDDDGVGGGGGGNIEGAVQPRDRPDLLMKDDAATGSCCCVFSVTDVPPTCRVEVMQSVGAPGSGRACRIFQSEEGGLSRSVEIRVSNTFLLYWTERQVALGGRVVVSEQEGFPMVIDEQDEVVFVRYGFVTPNQPKSNEAPAWHRQTASSLVADDSTYGLARIAT